MKTFLPNLNVAHNFWSSLSFFYYQNELLNRKIGLFLNSSQCPEYKLWKLLAINSARGKASGLFLSTVPWNHSNLNLKWDFAGAGLNFDVFDSSDTSSISISRFLHLYLPNFIYLEPWCLKYDCVYYGLLCSLSCIVFHMIA